MESLLMLLLVIAVVGFVVYLITTLIPMPAPFPNIIIAIAAICILLYALRSFGVLR